MDKLKRKRIRGYLLLAVLLLAAGIVLLQLQYVRFRDKELSENQRNVNTVAEVIDRLNSAKAAVGVSFDAHLQQNLRFMTATLAEDVTEGGYTGPTLFEDGAVAELRDDRVIWPDGVPETVRQLTAADIREGRRVAADVSGSAEAGQETAAARMIFTSGRISGDYYYVNWTNEAELLDNGKALLHAGRFLREAEEIFGGSLLLVSSDDASLKLMTETRLQPEAESALDLGFTPEMISQRRPVADVDHTRSLCTYAETEDGAATLIFVRPIRGVVQNAIVHVCMILLLILLPVFALLFYAFSVRKYVKTHQLTAKLKKRYQPEKLRRVLQTGGAVGAICVFVLSFVVLAISSLYSESITRAKTLNGMFDYLHHSVAEWEDYTRKQETGWCVYHGKQIAGLISRHPEAGTGEKLQEYCDIFGLDYIMVFDEKGRETESNSVYTGMTMAEDLTGEFADFRQLLKGTPSVVHDTASAPFSGETQLLAGVTIPGASGKKSGTQGALILAVGLPGQKDNDTRTGEQIRFLSAEDRICLLADSETGIIRYAGDDGLAGQTVQEIGLAEKCLRNGFSDFAVVNGAGSYSTTVGRGDDCFIYLTTNASLLSCALPPACFALAAYLLIALITIGVCMKGYNQENFRKWTASATLPDEDDGLLKKDLEEDSIPNSAELMIGRPKDKWSDKTPDVRIGILLKVIALLMVCIPTLFMLRGGGTGKQGSSLLVYILNGEWNRGLNLFSVSGILIVMACGALIVLVSNVVISLITGFVGRTGETVCRLLYSLIRYMVFLVILYYLFEFMGLSMSVYIASLSVVSLAISLGSQGMVADIMAGILIIFERQLKVGDIVEIDGYRGQVLEIGIRSTKLLCDGNDIRFISNSDIRSVVNKSMRISNCMTSVAFVTGESLESLEELLKHSLPEIGKKERRIMGEPILDGISNISGGGQSGTRTVSLRILCKCRERDQTAVKNFINREICLLCEREKIEIRL